MNHLRGVFDSSQIDQVIMTGKAKIQNRTLASEYVSEYDLRVGLLRRTSISAQDLEYSLGPAIVGPWT